MNQPVKKDEKRLWYLAYIIILTVILLYILFPERALTDYFKSQAENRYPNLNIEFDEINLSLSPGIKIYGLKISSKEDPDTPVYMSKKTLIQPSILGLLTGNSSYSFESSVNGGEISGFLKKKITNKKERVEATIDFNKIILDENVLIDPILGQRVEGILNGKITFMGDLFNLLNGNAEVSLELTDGKINLKKPFIELNEIEFDKINISGVLDKRKFNIKSLDITGSDINGSGSGDIPLKDNILSSRLRLKVEIEPSPTLLQENPLVDTAVRLIKKRAKDGKYIIDIKGTIGKPSLPLSNFKQN